ncbi:hypothetical protein BELL_0703g00030 [Botrytis elliptica]|uniref:Uncharacterized protein n=1 Tax=Botrytis elliptica TaxID=278938 RepID=A0A4Z1JBF8_9HELO|nr:hypothetical protein BELL_0703g00030 [Botrytis elliptica]
MSYMRNTDLESFLGTLMIVVDVVRLEPQDPRRKDSQGEDLDKDRSMWRIIRKLINSMYIFDGFRS